MTSEALACVTLRVDTPQATRLRAGTWPSFLIRARTYIPSVTSRRVQRVRARTLSLTPLVHLFYSSDCLQLSPGIIGCRCQLHGENKEAFRLAVEKAVSRKRLDGRHGAP